VLPNSPYPCPHHSRTHTHTRTPTPHTHIQHSYRDVHGNDCAHWTQIGCDEASVVQLGLTIGQQRELQVRCTRSCGGCAPPTQPVTSSALPGTTAAVDDKDTALAADDQGSDEGMSVERGAGVAMLSLGVLVVVLSISLFAYVASSTLPRLCEQQRGANRVSESCGTASVCEQRRVCEHDSLLTSLLCTALAVVRANRTHAANMCDACGSSHVLHVLLCSEIFSCVHELLTHAHEHSRSQTHTHVISDTHTRRHRDRLIQVC
jgi:hypothetical protein